MIRQERGEGGLQAVDATYTCMIVLCSWDCSWIWCWCMILVVHVHLWGSTHTNIWATSLKNASCSSFDIHFLKCLRMNVLIPGGALKVPCFNKRSWIEWGYQLLTELSELVDELDSPCTLLHFEWGVSIEWTFLLRLWASLTLEISVLLCSLLRVAVSPVEDW